MSEYHMVSARDVRAQKRRAFWGAVAAVLATSIQALLLVGVIPADFKLDKICQAIVMVFSAFGYRSALLSPPPSVASTDIDPQKMIRRKPDA